MQLSVMRLTRVVIPLQHKGGPTEHFGPLGGTLPWGTGLAIAMARLARKTKVVCMMRIEEIFGNENLDIEQRGDSKC